MRRALPGNCSANKTGNPQVLGFPSLCFLRLTRYALACRYSAGVASKPLHVELPVQAFGP